MCTMRIAGNIEIKHFRLLQLDLHVDLYQRKVISMKFYQIITSLIRVNAIMTDFFYIKFKFSAYYCVYHVGRLDMGGGGGGRESHRFIIDLLKYCTDNIKIRMYSRYRGPLLNYT